MVRIFATAAPTDPLSEIVSALGSHPHIDLVGTAETGRATVDAVRSGDVDALVVSHALSDLARLIRVSAEIPLNGSPTMVVAAERLSQPVLVRSLACGFDGAIALGDGPDAAAFRLAEIVDGRHRLSDDATLGDLSVSYGLLARPLVIDDPVNDQVVDLVASGLDDQEIAVVTGLTIQQVRNHIESAIHANGLSTRTHLAIMRASHVVIPDFA